MDSIKFHDHTALESPCREYSAKVQRDTVKTKWSSAIASRELAARLVEAGVIPPRTISVVITLKVNQPVAVEVECFADERIAAVDFAGIGPPKEQ